MNEVTVSVVLVVQRGIAESGYSRPRITGPPRAGPPLVPGGGRHAHASPGRRHAPSPGCRAAAAGSVPGFSLGPAEAGSGEAAWGGGHLGQAAECPQQDRCRGPAGVGVQESRADRWPVARVVPIGQGLVADHVSSRGQRLSDDGPQPCRAQVHPVARSSLHVVKRRDRRAPSRTARAAVRLSSRTVAAGPTCGAQVSTADLCASTFRRSERAFGVGIGCYGRAVMSWCGRWLGDGRDGWAVALLP